MKVQVGGELEECILLETLFEESLGGKGRGLSRGHQSRSPIW